MLLRQQPLNRELDVLGISAPQSAGAAPPIQQRQCDQPPQCRIDAPEIPEIGLLLFAGPRTWRSGRSAPGAAPRCAARRRPRCSKCCRPTAPSRSRKRRRLARISPYSRVCRPAEWGWPRGSRRATDFASTARSTVSGRHRAALSRPDASWRRPSSILYQRYKTATKPFGYVLGPGGSSTNPSVPIRLRKSPDVLVGCGLAQG